MKWLPDWTKNVSNVCKRYKKIIVPAVAVAGIAAFEAYDYFAPAAPTTPEVGLSDFLSQVDKGRIAEITLTNDGQTSTVVTGKYKDTNLSFRTSFPLTMTTDLVEELRQNNVAFSNTKPAGWSYITAFFWISQIAFFYIILGGPKRLLNLGLGKKLLSHEQNTGTTFDDVAGIDEAKGELQEIVDFLKNPERYNKVGAKIPKGVLLIGPPGTGKTLLARAVAGEAGVPFFSISGSDFVEIYVGVGASRVREMFAKANKNAPCIIFIDEIDALGGSREKRMGGGADEEHDQTLNQLLVGMSGISPNKGIIIIGATNMPEKLDPALLRPGRFDRKVVVPLPDARGRENILEVHTREIPLGEDVRLPAVARNTPQFSGADLANLVNEAALNAAQNNQSTVDMANFETAKDRVVLGAARRSMILTEYQRKLLAYHEGGHALSAIYLDGCDMTEKVTIIPRGANALGVTVNTQEDRYTLTLTEMVDRIAQLYGGREAERIIFGNDKITTGAANDIEVATQLARRMVMEFGMSQKLGQIDLRKDSGPLSAETNREIDLEIRAIIEKAASKTHGILVEHRSELDAIANELLARDTLSGDEIRAIAARVLSAAGAPTKLAAG